MGSTFDRTAGGNELHGLKEQSGRVIDDVRELGQMAASSAGDTVQELRARSLEALQAGREQAIALKGKLETRVSENPWKSIVIAAGVGALVGFALRRSR
jgi:ElaB/YqjD/DUF883 family membrane-anchored ribosome-binding protein